MSKNARGRKPLSKDNLNRVRAKILDAARKLFAEQGYQSISMRTLAQAVNMSPTSLYRFYPNKRAILIHIWSEVFDRLFNRCKQAADKAKNPRNAIIAYANCFVEYWTAHPDTYIMVYGEIDKPAKGESFFAESELVANEFAYLGEILAKTGIAETEIELTLQQLICIMHGVCHSLVTIPEMNWQEIEAITGGLVDRLIPD